MSTADGAAAAAAADNRHPGSIILPPFSEAKPHVLFAQIKEQFVIYGINADKLHYAHMVSALSTESYKIASVALAGLTDNRYKTAKQALLTAYSRTQNVRYQAVLRWVIRNPPCC